MELSGTVHKAAISVKKKKSVICLSHKVVGHCAGNSLFTFLTHRALIASTGANYIHRPLIKAICYRY